MNSETTVCAYEKVSEQHLWQKLHGNNTFKDIAIYSFQSLLKSEKVVITHLFVEIDFKTADHIVAVEKVALRTYLSKIL